MKNNPLLKFKPLGFIICLLTIVLSISIFVACKDTDEIVSGEIQTIPKNSTSYLKFNDIPLEHINASIKTILKDGNSPNDVHQLRTEVSNESINNIKKTILSKFSGDISKETVDPETMIFYFSEGNIENPNIKDINAISYFVSKNNDGFREHHLYVRNSGNNFILNKSYTSKVGTFELGDVNLLALTVLKNSKNIKWVLYNGLNSNIKPQIQSSEFKKAIFNNAEFIPYAASMANRCTSNCTPFDAGGNCGSDGNCYADMEGGGCLATDINSKGAKIKQGLNIGFARTFRDDFLSKTKKGKVYTDNYYKISKISTLNNAINSGNLLDHINFANKIFAISQKLQNGDSNEIILDKDTKTELLRFVKYYKTLSKNKEYQQLLIDLEDDFDDLSNKSKAKVLNFLYCQTVKLNF
jgi:hypothetical protein